MPVPPPGGHLLAAVDYGVRPLRPAPAPLQISVPLAQPGPGALREIWTGREPPRVRRDGRVRLSSSGPVVFGVAETPAGSGRGLEEATRDLYREILDVLKSSGHPHPLRFWNVLPRINETDAGLERYRWFCRGRAVAFEERFGPGFERHLCAASAVGSETGTLLVYFLAGAEGGIQVENPRQLSAYAYPPAYGPRSPSFARATRAPASLGGRLLISGTASIVGHRTLHAGRIPEQLRETLRNLETLTAGRELLGLKVFVRHARHFPRIREELERRLDPAVPVLYLRADVCRSDLLLEIEGLAG